MRLAGGERERERGSGRGGERGRKERGAGEQAGGLSFQIRALRASEGQRAARRCGTWGRLDRWGR